MLRRDIEWGFVAARILVPHGAVRGRAVLKQDRRQREVVSSDRLLKLVIVAVAAVHRLVVGHDRAAEVREQRSDDLEPVVAAGLPERAVALLARDDGVPGGIVGEREVDGGQVPETDSTVQDKRGEMFGADSADEDGYEKTVQYTAGAEEAVEGCEGQVIANSKQQLAR